MAENKGKFYMTTAIAYTSGKPHIGNTYEIILADAIARYKRAEGYDVYFQTGTDEHGQKIQTIADEKGVTPQAYVDEVVDGIKKLSPSSVTVLRSGISNLVLPVPSFSWYFS